MMTKYNRQMFFRSSANKTLKTQFCRPMDSSKTRHLSKGDKQNKGSNRIPEDTCIESRLSLQSQNIKSLISQSYLAVKTIPENYFNLNHFFKWISNYLAISNVLIEEAESFGGTSGTLLRQIKKLGDKIQAQMQLCKSEKGECLSIQKTQHKNATEWKAINQQLMKRIKQLQSQVVRLHQSVQDHEDNNLKMMIQLNQNQSGNISYFKIQLEESFEAYKLLEDKAKMYKQKLKQMESIKTLVEKDNEKKVETIAYLEKQLLRNPNKDRRISTYSSNGSKDQKKFKEKERYPEASIAGSITNSATGNYTNTYLRCAEEAELQDFISH